MVNSFVGRIPVRSMPAYTASKFALSGFTDAIRPEYADLGIHVAQINPGTVRMAAGGHFMSSDESMPGGEHARYISEQICARELHRCDALWAIRASPFIRKR